MIASSEKEEQDRFKNYDFKALNRIRTGIELAA